MSQSQRFRVGDLVIYALSKMSRHPGPRARSIQPARMGDDYNYVVDKYWRVAGTLPDDKLLLVTRRGKTRTVSATDPLLRAAGFWDKLLRRDRFPDDTALSQATAECAEQSST